MKPFYQDAAVTIYNGDCREILPTLGAGHVLVTDPVWPNSTPKIAGHERPFELFAEAASSFEAMAVRLAIHLGCDSDPKLLAAVPAAFKFFRVCWLRYSLPTHKGRLLKGADVAYLFGPPPPSRPGNHLISGDVNDSSANGKQTKHPCPRKLGHVRWLVERWSAPNEIIVDPFAGGGTTGRAAKDAGRKAILIEIDERWCESAATYQGQEVMAL